MVLASYDAFFQMKCPLVRCAAMGIAYFTLQDGFIYELEGQIELLEGQLRSKDGKMAAALLDFGSSFQAPGCRAARGAGHAGDSWQLPPVTASRCATTYFGLLAPGAVVFPGPLGS